jgi:ATP-dependent DNA helicase RecQ
MHSSSDRFVSHFLQLFCIIRQIWIDQCKNHVKVYRQTGLQFWSDMATITTPESILRNVFGYDQFKTLQREVIENVLKKRDTLAIMPTGGGKSLCYQIPALIFSGLTVVVSPLISLMKDQVEQLQAFGVPALFLNSSLGFEEYQQNINLVRSGKVKLLYLAPETLLMTRSMNLLAEVKLDCLTIDEAHCISEWGHDFRPEYRQLVEIRKRFPDAVCLALTATATERVRQDIMDILKFEMSNEFIASFNRDNLFIEVIPKSDPLVQTLEFLKRHPDQSGIIYCFSRRQVDDLSAALTRRGYSVRPYHAGLEDDDRRRNQELFIRDEVQIIVATIAFGMGINKPNVRFVIHYDLPKSIENYYQEIGRAGRDGLTAHCLLLYNYSDVQKQRYFIDQKNEEDKQVAYHHLNALTRYAENDGCRRVPLMAYFGETFVTDNCGMCDNCQAGQQQEADITILAQKFLSCVIRTGEMFGAMHVADVLLGSDNQKVKKFNHQLISTYGIGKELSRKQWLQISRQLVQKGYLTQEDQFGSLKLTPKAYTALKSREIITGVLPAEEPSEPNQAGELEYDHALFELLRAKRKELADDAHVPPYVIFSDRTLVEMATYYPQSDERLLKINGVGQVKAKRYGQPFLGVIQDYCKSHQIDEKVKQTVRTNPNTNKTNSSSRTASVAEAYNSGQSVQDLMEHYQVQAVTILDHLTKYALSGQPVRKGPDVLAMSGLKQDQLAIVLNAFREVGADQLKPVFENLNGVISYDELKISRLIFLMKILAD